MKLTSARGRARGRHTNVLRGKKREGDLALGAYNNGRKMALDGQVTYLSTESAADFQRPRTPRRSPRLRMYEEEEEQIESERVQSNLGMRAPIIGYEVVDQRQKFTVQWLNLLLVIILGSFVCSCVFLLCYKSLKVRLVTLQKRCGKNIDAIATFKKRSFLQYHCVYFLVRVTWRFELNLCSRF